MGNSTGKAEEGRDERAHLREGGVGNWEERWDGRGEEEVRLC